MPDPIDLQRRQCLVLGGAMATLGLAGCATPGDVAADDPKLSLVYGYIDMGGAPTPVKWVSLRCYSCKDPREHYNLGARDGLFFHVGVDPGSYQIDTFGGENTYLGVFAGTEHRYNFGTAGRNDSAVRIVQPGVHFVGAWRFVLHEGSWFKPDRFSMQALSNPSEKELLGRVIARLQGDADLKPYRRTLAMAQQRHAQLR